MTAGQGQPHPRLGSRWNDVTLWGQGPHGRFGTPQGRSTLRVPVLPQETAWGWARTQPPQAAAFPQPRGSANKTLGQGTAYTPNYVSIPVPTAPFHSSLGERATGSHHFPRDLCHWWQPNVP